MCCEATDALLEYVRRYLGLSGLRNLNAPRRLKLRVPVLNLGTQRRTVLLAEIRPWRALPPRALIDLAIIFLRNRPVPPQRTPRDAQGRVIAAHSSGCQKPLRLASLC